MAVSIVTYTGDGSTTQYVITFEYISRDDVVVQVNDVDASFTFINDTTVELTSAPSSGDRINIKRETTSTALVDFADGSTLFESDLDLSAKQSRYLAEEARDRADEAIAVINNNIDDVNTVADISTDVTTVAGQISPTNNIQTLAEIQDGTTATNAITTAASISSAISNVSSISSAVSTVSSDSADVQTLAGISADIQTLADIEDGTTATDAISNVAAIATSVSTVSGIATDVTNVAGKVTEIGRLGTADAVADLAILGTTDAVADMNTLAAISTDIQTVAGKASFITADFVSDLNTLATLDIVADLNQLATSDIVADINLLAQTDVIADLNTLATTDIVSDLNTLATTDIVADLNQLATSDFVSDLNTMATTANVTNLATVAADIANINALAPNITGVNSFAERYRVGTSDPTTDLDAGDLFFNTTSNAYKFYDGSSWQVVNVSGIGSVFDDTTPQLGGDLDTNGHHIKFPDGSITAAPNTNILSFGNSDDMKLWHQGGTNYIQGSQAISIMAADIYLRKGSYSSYETMASFIGDGAVNLFHNNVYKFGTTSTGIDVSGDVTASDDLFVNGGFARISDATTPTLELRNTDTTATGNQELGVIDFYGSDGDYPYAGVKASIRAIATNLNGIGNASKLSFSTTDQNTNEKEIFILDNNTAQFRNGCALYFWNSNNTRIAAIRPSSSQTSTFTLTLPPAGPSAADQILVSDASGNLSFEAKPTGANVATMMAFA